MKHTIYEKVKGLVRFTLYLLLPVVGGGVMAVSCSDTWDEHYESLGDDTGIHDGTLWQAIKSNPNLSNFASVIEGCDFARSLDGSQVFTVFAPTNDYFSQAEAQEFIASYKQQVQSRVVDDDNTVLKEFIQNHIALYNHSVSSQSNDSILLMNGKYAVLSTNELDGVPFVLKNQLYQNGVLYVLQKPVDYLSNVFEYISKDPDLDSLYSFLYNKHYYYRDFMPSLSVPGSIVNGKTQYLDSVFRQRNELFSYIGLISTEDSSYIMVAPTNNVWRQLIEEYEPYFNYPQNVNKRDSLVYTNSRLAIIEGTTFSRTFNTDESLRDSAMSESCMMSYNNRKLMWGAPFEYYQYNDPLTAPYGALAQTDVVKCSNGEVRKAYEWNINKLQTFFRYLILEAEDRSTIKELGKDVEGDSENKDSVVVVRANTSYVTSDNRNFYGKVWSNSFVEFSSQKIKDYYVTFNLPNVLSNIGYDIYMVTVPALAADTNATAAVRVPTKFDCTLFWPGGPAKGTKLTPPDGSKSFVTAADDIDYLLLAENYQFPVCTYDIDDENMQVTMRVDTNVKASEVRKGTYNRTLRIDCILVVPHGMLQLVDEEDFGAKAVLMFPHGVYDDRPYKGWYMFR